MAKTTLSLDRHPASAERELSLPKPPGVIRQFWARHPWWTDSFVAGAYFLPTFFSTLALFLIHDSTPAWLAALGLIAIGVGGTALLFRRRRPWTVLFIVSAMTAVASPLVGTVDVAAIPIALYAVAVYRSTRDAWLALACSAVVGTVTLAFTLGAYRTEAVPPFGAPLAASSSQFFTLMLLATLIGVNIGNRKRYVAALVDRARQLAKERDQQAQLATAAERARIAREMHDIVSHSLTVMVTLADGSAAATAASPGLAAEAMSQVAETGRHALSDMRRMLGLLHSDENDPTTSDNLEPQPGLAEMVSLIESFRAASLPIRYTSKGAPRHDQGEQLTVYRIVQESLTNVLRHAKNAREVTVDVLYEPSAISVVVTDDGSALAEPQREGSGRGLLGMSERVALYGGTLDSGPRAGRGWTVRAVLPQEMDGAQ